MTEPKFMQVLNETEMLTSTQAGDLIQWKHKCAPTLTFDDHSYMKKNINAIIQISRSSDNHHHVSASCDITGKAWNTQTNGLV